MTQYIGGTKRYLYLTSTLFGVNGTLFDCLPKTGRDVNAALNTPVATDLAKDRSKTTNLDFCGAWLNGAVYDESKSILHGFYHEEWMCDYARNSFTNKSIAYAMSTNGGLNWTKPGHPDNAIILPPFGNTTIVHQTGEGDHGVVVADDGYMYMLFMEWDGWPTGHRTIGVLPFAKTSYKVDA